MTDVPGVMRDKDDISTKYAELDIRATRQARSANLPPRAGRLQCIPWHECTSRARRLNDARVGGWRSWWQRASSLEA